jgi:hypothetical protein
MPEAKREEESYYFNYFKKLYESWEKSMAKVMEVWLNNPIFANSADRAIEKSIEFKGYIHDIMERTLRHRSTPTKYNMDKIAKSLDQLEVKLNKVEDKISKIQGAKRSTTKLKKGSSKKGGNIKK